MQHLDYQLKLKEIFGDESGRFEGYASVFGAIDHQNEVVMSGAFKNSLTQFKKEGRLPKMLWQHDPAMPIGTWEEMYEDEYGLYVRGRLLLDVQKGKDAYALLKSGAVDGLSIGFQIKQSHREHDVRILDELELFEVSLVTFMANPLAKITACKNWSELYDPTLYLMKRLHDLKCTMDHAERRLKRLDF